MNQPKEQLETLLSDYVEGNLSGEELKSVESYLESNPGVRDAVNRLMIDSEALRSLPRLTAPFDFSEDVRGQLERDLLLENVHSGRPSRRRLSSLLMTVAAMLILFVGIGGAGYWILSNRPAPFLDVASNAPAPSVVSEAAHEDAAAKPLEEKAARDDKGQNAGATDEKALADAGPARQVESLSRKTDDARAEVLVPADRVGEQKNDSPSASVAASPITPPSVADGFDGRAKDNTSALDKESRSRRSFSAVQAPKDVSELLDEIPRFNSRAVVLMIDSDQVPVANRAVQTFFSTNSVKPMSLAFDASRNRAYMAPKQEQDGVADSRQQQVPGSQVSGVVSNATVADPIAQAMFRDGSFAEGVHEPQVVLASGLTPDQATDLQASLQVSLGESQAIAYEVGGAKMKSVGEQMGGGGFAIEAKSESGKSEEEFRVVSAAPASQPALIGVGDRLRFTMVDPDASNFKTQTEVVVDAAGNIQLPLLESVKASEMTLAALRSSIVDQYVKRKLIRQPIVDIELKTESATTQPLTPALTRAETDASAKEGPGDDLIDVYLVVRGKTPTTQPTTRPAHSPPATQPQ